MKAGALGRPVKLVWVCRGLKVGVIEWVAVRPGPVQPLLGMLDALETHTTAHHQGATDNNCASLTSPRTDIPHQLGGPRPQSIVCLCALLKGHSTHLRIQSAL